MERRSVGASLLMTATKGSDTIEVNQVRAERPWNEMIAERFIAGSCWKLFHARGKAFTQSCFRTDPHPLPPVLQVLEENTERTASPPIQPTEKMIEDVAWIIPEDDMELKDRVSAQCFLPAALSLRLSPAL
eukprot:255701-Rhodomonas_salina.2